MRATKRSIFFLEIAFIALLTTGFSLGSDKTFAQNRTAARFEISFSSEAHPGHITGRVYLIISKDERREPRFQRSPYDALMWGEDIHSLKPGEAVVIDDEVLDNLTQRVKEADFSLALVERVEKAETALQEAVTREESLLKTISQLTQRIEALEADDDKKRQQWQEDLPARTKQQTRVVYRPRVERAASDEEVDEMEDWQKQKSNSNIPSY